MKFHHLDGIVEDLRRFEKLCVLEASRFEHYIGHNTILKPQVVGKQKWRRLLGVLYFVTKVKRRVGHLQRQPTAAVIWKNEVAYRYLVVEKCRLVLYGRELVERDIRAGIDWLYVEGKKKAVRLSHLLHFSRKMQ